MPTFDIVSEIDLQEVRNAVDQANREAATRFDFKNTDAIVEYTDKELTLSANTGFGPSTTCSRRRWSSGRCP
jgi:cyclic-di-GMP-binding protein